MIRRALFFLGFLVVGCEAESDPAAAANLFFSHLASSRPAAAFAGAAFSFRHQQSAADFDAAAYETGLTGCTLQKIEKPAVVGKAAKLLTEVRTRHGVVATLVVTLARDRGEWRVFSVKPPMNIETGISENFFTRIGKGNQLASVHAKPLPDERTAMAMAKETMLSFHDAIQQKSFEDFYEGVARSWQRQLTLGMLTRTFDGFIHQRTNLIAIKDLEGVLKIPPRIDTEGLLTITGSFPTEPHRIDFDIKYFYELPNWRPFGVAVRLIQ